MLLRDFGGCASSVKNAIRAVIVAYNESQRVADMVLAKLQRNTTKKGGHGFQK